MRPRRRTRVKHASLRARAPPNTTTTADTTGDGGGGGGRGGGGVARPPSPPPAHLSRVGALAEAINLTREGRGPFAEAFNRNESLSQIFGQHLGGAAEQSEPEPYQARFRLLQLPGTAHTPYDSTRLIGNQLAHIRPAIPARYTGVETLTAITAMAVYQSKR